ncbi:MAG: 1-phosphofructokinase [Sarcina sp.]
MIITVTLNPAIDHTVEIDNFEINKVNRISNSRKDVGGKGINVSKVLKELGVNSKAIGILAGKNGEYIQSFLEKAQIENEFLFIEGETRVNLKVVDKNLGTNTDINELGVEVKISDIERLKEIIKRIAIPESIIVFAGSVPKNVEKEIYFDLIKIAKEQGAKTILDAEGELFEEGVKALPSIIKPNNFELEKMFNKEMKELDDIISAGESLVSRGIEEVIISLGDKGALFIEKEQIIYAKGLKVSVLSTVGAGDSMVAALAYGYEKKLDKEMMIKLAMGVSAASVTVSGTQVPNIDTINELKNKVELKRMR